MSDSRGAQLLAREKAHTTAIYPQRDLCVVRGKGALLWDVQDREFLDLGANYGVANVGHCHPEVVAAMEAQARKLCYVSPTFGNDTRTALLEALVATMPSGSGLQRVFLCNSGTEANEAALKFALVAGKGRTGLVAAKRGYHGRTFGSLALTFNPKYREMAQGLLPPVQHVSFNDCEALKGAIGPTTAAVILECVQGEGGIHVADPDFLRAARDLCTDTGAVLIFDEIQTGLGRTGRMWSCQHSGVSPDVLTVAKSLAGGLPMGAAVMTAAVAEAMPAQGHGSTFSGGPVVSAAAVATLQVLQKERLPKRAAELGTHVQGRLKAMAGQVPSVREGRGLGLMVALELKEKSGPYLNTLIQRGIIALPAGATVVRMLPPLVISREQLDHGLDVLQQVLQEGGS